MVLSLFTRGYDRKLYIGEAARLLPISRGTAQAVLEYLEAKQVLRSATRGRARLLSLRRGDHARDFYTLAEIYLGICFREEEPIIAGVLSRIAPLSRDAVRSSGVTQKGLRTRSPASTSSLPVSAGWRKLRGSERPTAFRFTSRSTRGRSSTGISIRTPFSGKCSGTTC